MSEFEENPCVRITCRLLRSLNFISGIGVLSVGLLVLLDVGFTFRTILNLIVTSVFGILLLAGEFNLTTLNENCKFLATFAGRSMYDFLIGGWVFSLRSFFLGRPNAMSEMGNVLSLITYLVISSLYNPFNLLLICFFRHFGY